MSNPSTPIYQNLPTGIAFPQNTTAGQKRNLLRHHVSQVNNIQVKRVSVHHRPNRYPYYIAKAHDQREAQAQEIQYIYTETDTNLILTDMHSGPIKQ